MTCLVNQFSEVSPQWDALLAQGSWSTIFLSSDWQRIWWEQFGRDEEALKLLTIGSGFEPLGIAPMMLEDGVLTFIGGTDLFDYHDFIGVEAACYPDLADCLSGLTWQAMILSSIPSFSATVSELPAIFADRGFRVEVDLEDVVPGVALPNSWEDYVSALAKKDRHELRRKLRRLEAAGDYRLVHSTSDSLERDLSIFTEVMKESREEKREFLDPERESFFHRIVYNAMNTGHLQLQFLELDGEPMAAILAFDYGGRRLLYNSGYRLEFGHLSAGLMCKALSIKDAIEHGLSYFDFLRGPEPYKYHLGASDVDLFRITIRR